MGKPATQSSAHDRPAGHGTLCGARTKQGGECGRPAGWGTGHLGVGRCKHHAGSTPTHELAGVIELARRQAAVMGQPLDIDPHEAILQCIRIAAGEVRYCSDRIADLQDDDAVGPVVTTHRRPRKFFGGSEIADDDQDEDDTDEPAGAEDRIGWVTEIKRGAPALHMWIVARREAMDRLVTYSATALKAGVEERRVRVAERAGEMMAQLIRGVLSDLGVPLDDPRTREVVVRHLRLVEGGGEAAA